MKISRFSEYNIISEEKRFAVSQVDEYSPDGSKMSREASCLAEGARGMLNELKNVLDNTKCINREALLYEMYDRCMTLIYMGCKKYPYHKTTEPNINSWALEHGYF